MVEVVVEDDDGGIHNMVVEVFVHNQNLYMEKKMVVVVGNTRHNIEISRSQNTKQT